jgi:hypothetical protein
MREIARELGEGMPVEAAAAASHQFLERAAEVKAEPVVDLQEVMALVSRLDAALAGDPRRHEWATLQLLDSQPRHFDTPQLQYVRHVLARDPQELADVGAELSARIAELERLELELEDEIDDDEQENQELR